MGIDLTRLDVSQSGQLGDYGHDTAAWLYATAIKCDLCGEHFDATADGSGEYENYRWVCLDCEPAAREDISDSWGYP